jgi:hypothetical protein
MAHLPVGPGWIINHGYDAVISEKTIFIKRQDDQFIIHAILMIRWFEIYLTVILLRPTSG